MSKGPVVVMEKNRISEFCSIMQRRGFITNRTADALTVTLTKGGQYFTISEQMVGAFADSLERLADEVERKFAIHSTDFTANHVKSAWDSAIKSSNGTYDAHNPPSYKSYANVPPPQSSEVAMKDRIDEMTNAITQQVLDELSNMEERIMEHLTALLEKR